MRPPDRKGSFSAGTIGLVVTLAVSLLLIAGALLVPLSVRNGAPFGNQQTVDFERGIAVLGAEITPNYDGMDRLGLDLRAYSDAVPGDQYDFIVSIRDIDADRIVRSVAISVDVAQIPASKPPFHDVLTDVRFDPIPDSAGVAYYVDVERGPRNADDVVALWGVQAYSSLTAADVMEDAIASYDLGYPSRTTALLLVVLTLLSITGAGAVIGTTTAALVDARWRDVDRAG
ncbi:MAG TPA: hypothetical protein VGT61_04850 [Thermomicrobiales bacterium]|jgi:hypothetical protein|nr:hypothetical protein [Thermomicrobiales bacterium]